MTQKWRASAVLAMVHVFVFLSFYLPTPGIAIEPVKVVRTAYASAENGFDCAIESDEFTGTLCDNIFDTLLQYDYLARPIRMQPRAALALPEISADGKTYTIRLKRGITFTNHPAFKGIKRELVAADYVFSMKRLLDPTNRSKWQFLLDGKLEGLNELAADAKKSGKFNYDKPIRGLEAVDSHTLVIRLIAPDYNLPYILAMPATAAFAREVVEQYGRTVGEHPIGTGPFRLKEWRRSSRITLEANPDFRGEAFESVGNDGSKDALIVAHLKGKRLPLIQRIEIDVIDEDQPRWLAFLGGEHDYIRPIPPPLADAAFPGGKLAPNLIRAKITTTPDEGAWLTYTTFNMEDKTIGGYTPERIALRRAISMAFPIQDEVAVIEKGQAEAAWSPIARGMAGFVDEKASFHEYNPARAKALLDMYGFIDRDGDGWREMPDGSPLAIDHASVPDQRVRSRNELWGRAMERIGVRMTFNKVEKLPELRKLATLGKIPMFSYGWIADYPDGENFLQLFWSKSIGGANYTRFSRPEFDALYERIKVMPDTPARTELYRQMVHILWVYNPWRVNTLKQGSIAIQPWVIGYKKHPFGLEPFRYLDIDTNKLPANLRK